MSRVLRIFAAAAASLLGMWLASGTALAAVPDDPQQLLKYADSIKSSNNSEFDAILKKIRAGSVTLSPPQQLYFRYLSAWQTGYRGDYVNSVRDLQELVAETDGDTVLHFRAGISAVNLLALSGRYVEAYRGLSGLLDTLPQINDEEATEQAQIVAGISYNQAGQYDLGTSYAEKLLASHRAGSAACKATQLKYEGLYKSGKLDTFDDGVAGAIQVCEEAKEPLWGNIIRTYVANRDIDAGRAGDAIQLVKAHYDELQRTHYARLTSEFDSILARAYWKQGDIAQAKQYAQSAIEKAVKNEITKPLADAYEVLYEVAKQQGDFENALAYHEKYAAADKGYLTDTSARTLAYQMVNQQVLDKKRQIDALNEKNERLQLQQQVNSKTAETARLYIALLIVVLAFIGFWAYKTKRSQLRFMRLARRDGLTGIFNRQHFIDAASDQLRYCAKSARDACVVVIDLDHFKSVNDVYGHATGDLVLKRAVRTCEDHLRSIDIFGRLGGEEFGIVLPDCAMEQALRCAEELRKAIADVSGSDARIDFPVSASFGIAATHSSGYDLRELLANADSALYEAKREGRNRIAAYESSATAKSVEAAAKAARNH